MTSTGTSNLKGATDAPEPSQQTDSLLRRLAGPSVTKAGLAKDQSEINRIIAEASKGSKFYENEKRKDKELTERIAKILKHRDEAVKGVDLSSVEQSVDQILVKLEAQRDLTQIIVHVDMDAFYANVELLDNPDLKGKPFAVGKGVLTTASYEARKFGARSGMSSFISKKLCPELILLDTHFDRYLEMSKRVMDVFRRYDLNMCAAGCDEGYLNITAYCEEHLIDAEECVREMRETVHRETKLTVSAGIAPNKMLAKICSDKNKPNGQFKLDFNSRAIKAFVHDLSIRKVPGVGRVNERLLESIGIKTCGDIYTHRAVLSLMDKQFGLHFLLQVYLGIASNVVQPHTREERKSIGAERTFMSISDKDRILQKLEDVAAELESDMTDGGWTGKTVTLKYKLDTYQVFTRAKSFDRWVSSKKEDLFAIGKELLMPEFPLTIRLIGLRVTKLKDLKAEAESKAAGIMKFFGTTDRGGSPTRNRRASIEESEQAEELTQLRDAFEDAMPGYHEEAEADDGAEGQGLDFPPMGQIMDVEDYMDSSRNDLDQAGDRSDHRPRPPYSAPAPTHSQSFPKPVSTEITKGPFARASSTGPSASSSTSRGQRIRSPSPRARTTTSAVDTQTCPICSKTMLTDNDGLNAHIDFCLSKEAIREAQATSSTNLAPISEASGPDISKGFRPRSIADLLSGSGAKRAAPSSRLTEGLVKRKRRK
ncbi:DNA/RNA polymerase [Daedalea quercina L-15889]|uniref:DNA polymerase kappa n=1 Tax=Daedalea quercina L-15889 TaxID=1314783 RepID=A0A165N1B0_9APHY|nr:DNA/RNA polymerase [Daedalea quercina L-15889]